MRKLRKRCLSCSFLAILVFTCASLFGCITQEPAKAPELKKLQSAVETKDQGTILRTFHEAVYDQRWWKQSEVISGLKSFLAHPDLFVRRQAAEKLYIVGDSSGYSALLDILKKPDQVIIFDYDDRLRIAQLFAQYRERRASSDILELYRKIGKSSLLNALVRLEREKTSPEVISKFLLEKKSAFGVFNLSIAHHPDVKSYARDLFLNADGHPKNIAAWAAIRSGETQPYLEHLLSQAEKAVKGEIPSERGYDSNQFKEAFKYVVSIQHPLVSDLLTRALESSNLEIREIATVNLIFNHPRESEAARQLILRQLRGAVGLISYELMWNLVIHLDDQEIRVAAEKNDWQTQERNWSLALERKAWPVFNWVDQYVINLNSEDTR